MSDLPIDQDLFFALTPELILDAVETSGLRCTGRCLQLNSLENRVFEIEVEDDDGGTKFVISKFYRPGRWSFEQIKEEHRFLSDLLKNDILVVAPLEVAGETLFTCPKTLIKFSLFPKCSGRNPDEFSAQAIAVIGRTFARMHLVGAQSEAPSRLKLSIENFGYANLQYLLKSNALPSQMSGAFESLLTEIFKLIEPLFNQIEYQRIHGDAHKGNIIEREGQFYFVDFDDMLTGPCIQDLWLLYAGRDVESRKQFLDMIEAYEEIRSFDRKSFFLIEPLRALRVLHFSVWIHKRWEDPYFKRVFDSFGTENYWSEQLQFFYEQRELITQSLNTGTALIEGY